MKKLFESWRRYVKEAESSTQDFTFSEAEVAALNKSIRTILGEAQDVLGAEFDGATPMNFITTNTDATNTSLDVAELQTLMQKCYNAGGVPDLLIANPATFADLNAVESSSRVRTVIDDPRRGRVPVNSVFHEFGETQMVRNRWCHSETAFVVKKENVQQFKSSDFLKIRSSHFPRSIFKRTITFRIQKTHWWDVRELC